MEKKWPNRSVIARTSAGKDLALLPALANRHGLITGATGTGKTVTLQVFADHFSRLGVPVFLADVKGDLSGVAAAGSASPKLLERLNSSTRRNRSGGPTRRCSGMSSAAGASLSAPRYPTWARFSSASANLNPTQQGVLTLVFKIADDDGLLLLDLKDLRAMLQTAGDTRGSSRPATATSRRLPSARFSGLSLEIEQQGGESFFGEPMLDIDDLLQTDHGHGVVNILVADELIRAPKVYATFLLWMLSELFERLPEVGDPDKPTVVFFFDEAHLLFNDAPDSLVGEDRAGGAPHPIEGCGRVLRDAESDGHAGFGPGSARESRAARAARVHTARSESREVGGADTCGPIRGSTSRRRSPRSPSAKRSSPCWTRRGARRRPSAPGSCRPLRASVR